MASHKRLPRLSDIVGWFSISDNNVIYDANGSFIKVYTFWGSDGSNMTDDEVNTYYVALNNIFMRLKRNYLVHVEMHKAETGDMVKSKFADPLLQDFENHREENIARHRIYGNQFYLSITYRWPSDFAVMAGKMMDKSNKEVIQVIKDSLKEFTHSVAPVSTDIDTYLKELHASYLRLKEMEKPFVQECDVIANALTDYFVEIRPCTKDETLTYLHDCISDHHVSIASSFWLDKKTEIKKSFDAYLVEHLKDATFSGGLYPKIGDKYIGVVGLKDIGKSTFAFMFDRFNNMDCEFRFVTRFIGLDKDQAVSENKKIITLHKQREKSLFAVAWEALSGHVSEKVDADAVLDGTEASDAYAHLSRDDFSLGYLTMDVVILNRDFEKLQDELKEVVKIVNDTQCVANIEKYNAAAAWLSTLPGNYQNNVRRFLVTSTNFANVAPFSAYWDGEKKNKHFASLAESAPDGKEFVSDPLLQCSTPEHLPFYLNLHVGDVGHTLVVGPTGSGKSVLLNTISANFRKYPDCKIFIFDKSASSRVLTKSLGGNFYNLLVDKESIAFQPLAHIDSDVEKTWVLEWLVNYLEASNVKMTPQKRNTILTALDSVAGAPENERTITALITMLQDEEIRSSLRDLSLKGAYGSLFDSDIDHFGTGRWQVFEMEKLMENHRIVAPTLDYLFHRIESQLDGVPALMVLDECWLFLRNEAFRNKIVEYLKDLRKKNCAVVMATQNLSDLDENLIPIVSANCLTKIFLPNNSINDLAFSMYQRFDLNDTEIATLGTMKPKRQYFYKSSLGTRIFDLSLSPLELAFLGATSKEDQLLVSRLESLSPTEFSNRWKSLKHVS